MNSGFLYALINPSMPDLVKVGKTTRTTAERRAEISSATGVPTPFILAYEQPVEDCDFAETWVHEELTRRGYRKSPNREFFNGPLHEIVAVIAAGAVAGSGESTRETSSENKFTKAKQLGQELSLQGDMYRDGSDDVLQNYAKALGFYEQAAALGDAYSIDQAAELLLHGADGVKINIPKALDYFKRLLAHDAYVAGKIGKIYSEAGQPQSAIPYWEKLSEIIDERTSSYRIEPLWRYCFDVANHGIKKVISDNLIGEYGSILIGGLNFAIMEERITPYSAEVTRQYIVSCVGKAWDHCSQQ